MKREQERQDLLIKAKQLAKLAGGSEDPNKEGTTFFRVALEHEYDGRVRSDVEEEER
jgi:hypothetical protein